MPIPTYSCRILIILLFYYSIILLHRSSFYPSLTGIAKTGSGKTLTFLVPALLRMTLDGPGRHSKGVIRPRLLILAPTRELAMQSHNVVKEIGGKYWK